MGLSAKRVVPLVCIITGSKTELRHALHSPTASQFVFDSLAVDPVVEGKTRSEQFYRGDSQGKKVLLMKPTKAVYCKKLFSF